jgi:glycerophosphoryl diester phosphodiesterase
MGHAPENTLASVRKALELGAPCVEVDVFYVDDHLVVFHDERLERTTNGIGYICDQKFDFLRTLDAGKGERIPTLTEVVETIDRGAGLNIELKGPGAARPVVESIALFRKRGWHDDLFLVSSFNRRELEEVRRCDSRIKIGVLISGLPVGDAAFASALGAYSVHPSARFVSRRFVDDAHSRDLRVFTFTVDHPDDIRKMKRIGVDGVFTNFPERVLQHIADEDISPGWH